MARAAGDDALYRAAGAGGHREPEVERLRPMIHDDELPPVARAEAGELLAGLLPPSAGALSVAEDPGDAGALSPAAEAGELTLER